MPGATYTTKCQEKQCKCIVDEVDDRGQRSGRIQALTSWEASPIDKPIWLTSVFLHKFKARAAVKAVCSQACLRAWLHVSPTACSPLDRDILQSCTEASMKNALKAKEGM